MSTMSTIVYEAEGSTIPQPKRSQSRKWCFTLNNYTEDEYNSLFVYISTKNIQYVFGKEVGENGTPHIQGYLESKSPLLFTSMKKLLPRAHWEKGKGSTEQNLDYCSKDGDFVTNIEKKMTSQEKIIQKKKLKYESVVWKDWQVEVLNIIKGPVNDRTVYWLYDPIGNNGKTFLCNYIALHYECVIADGKKENIFNQVKMKSVDEDKSIQIILVDIPRASQEFINYGVIEKLKDGLIYSGKYEGGVVHLDDVHVICFSNEKPDFSKMSMDRWSVIEL